MNKKMTYFAPVTEQMEVRLEANFLDSLRSGASASMTNADLYDSGNEQDW